MTKERSLFGRFFGGNPSRADREEQVLRYIIHRTDEDGDLHEVLEEPYVRHHSLHDEIGGIWSNPELVHARRERPEYAFGSGELDPRAEQPTQRKR